MVSATTRPRARSRRERDAQHTWAQHGRADATRVARPDPTARAAGRGAGTLPCPHPTVCATGEAHRGTQLSGSQRSAAQRSALGLVHTPRPGPEGAGAATRAERRERRDSREKLLQNTRRTAQNPEMQNSRKPERCAGRVRARRGAGVAAAPPRAPTNRFSRHDSDNILHRRHPYARVVSSSYISYVRDARLTCRSLELRGRPSRTSPPLPRPAQSHEPQPMPRPSLRSD